MRRGVGPATACVVTLLLLAGCAGSDASPEGKGPASPSSVIDVGGGNETGDVGNIEGVVTDDALNPIAGAQVALLDLDAAVVTDEGGAFVMQNVPAGDHQIAAQALGYDSVAKGITIATGETLQLSLILTPVAVAGEAFVEVLGPWKGFVNCVFGTPVLAGVCSPPGAPNEKSSFTFKMHNETTVIVGELRWAQNTAGTSKKMGLVFSFQGRQATHWYCFGSGLSPVQWRYVIEDRDCTSNQQASRQVTGSAPKDPNTTQTLFEFVSIPFTSPGSSDPFPAHLAIQQSFEVVMSLFQNSAPDDEYTAFPDA